MDKVAEVVKKPVEAIQCMNSFSLLQRKIYNVLLANAAGNLRPEVTHRISIGILCKLMEYNSRDYDTIKDRFRELRRMDIEWDIINEKGNKVWTNTSPLSLARVIEGEGICEYEFTKSLLPFLDRPAQYAKFSLAIQSKFRSGYGLALYENCERYRKIGHTRAFDIPTFRKLMGLKDSEYLEFYAMKRRVIDQAVKEVNSHADFIVKPDYEKAGRNVIKIRFDITLKAIENSCISLIEHDNDNSALISKLKTFFALPEKEIAKLFDKYEIEYIQEKVNYVLGSRTFKIGNIDSMGAYLTNTLHNDYKSQISSKEVRENIRHSETSAQMEKERLEKLVQAAKSNYDRYVYERLIDNVMNLYNEAADEFEKCFLTYLTDADPVACSHFQKKGYSSGFVYPYLKRYVQKHHPDLIENILTWEEYSNSITK